MLDRKEKNAEIFLDTQQLYKSDKVLAKAVRHSRSAQEFISGNSSVEAPAGTSGKTAEVIVSAKRSLEAAINYAKQGKKVCVLNFASATNPGGGVVHGSSAQEESICRCTTLYPCLNCKEMWDYFYTPHREAGNPLYNNDCIYTPEVVVFKSDTDFPELLSQNEWQSVNILTCAAPNLRRKPSNSMNPNSGNAPAEITDKQLETLLTSRIRRIFEIAAAHENEVLILGAFGCGAFRNPPAIVSGVFKSVMQDFLGCFETIEYAVYCTERETENYNAFKKALNRK